MKIFLLAFLLPLLFCGSISGQDIASVFINMPSEISPAISKVNKEDLIDFRKSNMKAVVTNSLDDKVELEELTDSYILLKTSSTGSLQMKMLPLNDTTDVVCVVRTVCPKACLSNIRFFSTDWKELDASHYFMFPDISSFLTDSSKEVLDSIAHSSLSDIKLFEYTLSSTENTVSIKTTIGDYVSNEEKDFLKNKLKGEPVVMTWRNGRFEE